MTTTINQTIEKKKKLTITISEIALDPKLYFTMSIFAGESSPPFFPFSSGWMYIFGFIGLLLMIVKGVFTVRGKINAVFFIYLYIIIRNFTINTDLLFSYYLPNIGTAFVLFFFSCFFYNDYDIELIEFYLFIFSAILAVLGLIKLCLNPFGRLAVFGGPNGYYKNAILFEVMCFRRFVYYKKRFYLFLIIIAFILCFATGSKGGVVTIALITVMELLFYVHNSNSKRRKIFNRIIKTFFISAGATIVLFVIINQVPSIKKLFDRAVGFVAVEDLNRLTSISARTGLIRLGFQFFKESPIIGKGALYTKIYTDGMYPYSHNIFIEFLSEQGILGTFFLLCFLLSIIRIFLVNGFKNQELFFLLLYFLIYFTSSLFSGNVLDSKTIFFFGELIINCSRNKNYSYAEKQRYS